MNIINNISAAYSALLGRDGKPTKGRSIPQDKTVVAKIISEFKDQNRAEINKWRQALKMATHPTDPKMYLLQDLFDNLWSDGHFIAEWELRKSATLCADFSIINKLTGDIDTELTQMFRDEWFFNLREDMLNFIPRGFTLMELTDPQRLEFKMIPRRNVQALNHRVYPSVTAETFIDYRAPEYAHQLIEVGREDNLGMMADLLGLLIWKRNAQQSWAEFSEKYGMPLIKATTNKTAKQDIDAIEHMLMALGEAARAVLPEGTTVDVVPFSAADSWQVYDKQIERINSEISKPLVGGTMITDNGSSRSQSEVHERNLDDKIALRDKFTMEFIVNGQLMPIMQYWGHPVNPQIHTFRHDATFELTVKEHWDVIAGALNHYDIPEEWISKTFNFPINGKVTRPVYTMQGGNGFAANFR